MYGQKKAPTPENRFIAVFAWRKQSIQIFAFCYGQSYKDNRQSLSMRIYWKSGGSARCQPKKHEPTESHRTRWSQCMNVCACVDDPFYVITWKIINVSALVVSIPSTTKKIARKIVVLSAEKCWANKMLYSGQKHLASVKCKRFERKLRMSPLFRIGQTIAANSIPLVYFVSCGYGR